MRMLRELVCRIGHHGEVGLWSLRCGWRVRRSEWARRKADPGAGGCCDVTLAADSLDGGRSIAVGTSMEDVVEEENM